MSVFFILQISTFSKIAMDQNIKHQITIIIPVFNEVSTVREFHEKLSGALAQKNIVACILYVDDGSTDGTGEALDRLGTLVIHLGHNVGYGGAIKKGIRKATTDLIAIIDCDDTYDPYDLIRLYENIDGYDMVVGQRPREHGLRFFAKTILQTWGSYAIGSPIPDINSGLRIFKRELAQRVITLLPNGFSLTSTITLAAFYFAYQIRYVPISYGKRAGKSKIRPVKAFSNFILLLTRIMVLFNPLRFFLPASGVTGLIGLVFLIRDVLNAHIAQTAVLMIINSCLLFSIGVLAEAMRWKQ
jgi:Glycosyltransferases involved in cell wall biogenesis